jgi:nucleotide-binding universal stress UspA family protein
MRVLLPIDNTEHSKLPLDVLLTRSWPKQLEVKVLSVVDKKEAMPTAEQFVAEVVKTIKAKLPDATVSSEVVEGDSREIILDDSSAWKADLIIMGARGRRGLSRIVLGSVSQTVLLYGSCHTLIAHAQKAGQGLPIKRILVPVDNSPHSQNALEWLSRTPWAPGSEIKLLGVVATLAEEYSDPANPIYSSSIEHDWEKAKAATSEYLAQCKTEVATKFPDCKVTTEQVEGDVADCIIKNAEAWNAQLIFMGSRGNHGLKKIWLGSVSQEVVLGATVPVEVIKLQHQ